MTCYTRNREALRQGCLARRIGKRVTLWVNWHHTMRPMDVGADGGTAEAAGGAGWATFGSRDIGGMAPHSRNRQPPSNAQIWGSVVALLIIAYMAAAWGLALGSPVEIVMGLVAAFMMTSAGATILDHLDMVNEALRVWRALAVTELLGKACRALLGRSGKQ